VSRSLDPVIAALENAAASLRAIRDDQTADPMDELEQFRALKDALPGLIVAARQANHTWEAIARAAGMTRQGVASIYNRTAGPGATPGHA
jgi:hypothetical protein